jgi:hypothetical protein
MSLCNTLNIYVQHMPYDSIVSFISAQNSAHSCKCLYDRVDNNVNFNSLLYVLINLALQLHALLFTFVYALYTCLHRSAQQFIQ